MPLIDCHLFFSFFHFYRSFSAQVRHLVCHQLSLPFLLEILLIFVLKRQKAPLVKAVMTSASPAARPVIGEPIVHTRTSLHRQGAVYKIKCCDCQASYIGETGRNLNIRLTEHKRATKNGDVNNHIVEHHLHTNHRFDWDSAECVTYSTGYFKRLTLESWFTNLEQTPLSRCQQLPAACKRLVNRTDKHYCTRRQI